jgi:Ni2+-binding GTPase involved in maturation of urease and hydrogenase
MRSNRKKDRLVIGVFGQAHTGKTPMAHALGQFLKNKVRRVVVVDDSTNVSGDVPEDIEVVIITARLGKDGKGLPVDPDAPHQKHTVL